MEDKELYEKARDRIKELKDFYSHLVTYVIVNAILIFINLKFSPGYHWFYWVLLGWGIGLVVHFIDVFGFSKGWEEKKIKEYIQKYKEKEEKN